MVRHRRKNIFSDYFQPIIPNFLASNVLNAFILNSILLAFITIFASRLKTYESTTQNKHFCLIIMIIYVVLFVIAISYYIYSKRNTLITGISTISIFIPILLALIFITCVILYVVSFNHNNTDEKTIPNSEKVANTIISFFTTILLSLFVYFIMYKLFHFGGGLLISVQTGQALQSS